MNATQAANMARLGAEQGLGSQALNTAQWGLTGQTAANQSGEAAGAARQADLAAAQRANLSTMLGTRNTQGMNAANYYGNVYGSQASLRQNLAGQGRQVLTGQQAAAQEGRMGSAQLRTGAAGTGFSATNAATQGRTIPGVWERLLTGGG